ncbi:4-hydroxy-tetrahydrodipicolinate synthase [Candidatus Karelsulcia muelleri]|uniref:4-hydroxy-tetrahydrodipicolinate synthase n=1 Tax=Candidatus Karelsulcia muelleri TaxID=336810 RepID=UPI0035C89AD2
MKNINLYGIGIALVTPFNQKGEIDFLSLEKIVSYVIDEGVQYLVLLGTTGETPTLKLKEKIDIINCVKNISQNRIPIVLGMGSNNTEDVLLTLKVIKLDNFEAILSVCPYYNKPSQEGIYNHFKTISENTDIKIIIYNVPHRTGTNINLETINRLINNRDNIIGIKEASGNSGNMIQSYNFIKHKIKKDFLVFSGDDTIGLPIVLGGGDGIISVIGQAFPKELDFIYKFAYKNKVNKAYKLYYQISKILNLVFQEGNPSGIKTLLKIKGLCNKYVRLPLNKGSKTLEKKLYIEYNHMLNIIENV